MCQELDHLASHFLAQFCLGFAEFEVIFLLITDWILDSVDKNEHLEHDSLSEKTVVDLVLE